MWPETFNLQVLNKYLLNLHQNYHWEKKSNQLGYKQKAEAFRRCRILFSVYCTLLGELNTKLMVNKQLGRSEDYFTSLSVESFTIYRVERKSKGSRRGSKWSNRKIMWKTNEILIEGRGQPHSLLWWKYKSKSKKSF